MKRAKADVDYSIGKPAEHCKICAHFRTETMVMKDGRTRQLVMGTCTKVMGEIDPRFWCKLFEKK